MLRLLQITIGRTGLAKPLITRGDGILCLFLTTSIPRIPFVGHQPQLHTTSESFILDINFLTLLTLSPSAATTLQVAIMYYKLWVQLQTRNEGSNSTTFDWNLLLTCPHQSEDPRLDQDLAGPVDTPHLPLITYPSAHDALNEEAHNTPDTVPGTFCHAQLIQPIDLGSSGTCAALIRIGTITEIDIYSFTTVLENVPARLLSRRLWVLEALRCLRDVGLADIPPVDDPFEWGIVQQGINGLAVRRVTSLQVSFRKLDALCS